MKESSYKAVMFWVFLTIFVATAALGLLSLVGWVQVDPEYKKWIFYSLLAEVVGCIITYWRQFTESFAKPPAIEGEWNYECIRPNKSSHGGECTIEVKKGKYGWDFSIKGIRTWVQEVGKAKENLGAKLTWQSSWGTFTGTDTLCYEYTVYDGQGNVRGFGTGNVKTAKGAKKPDKIIGNYHQVDSRDPIFGAEEFTRKT